MSGSLDSTLNILLLVFGFGFVIFWHELGHFLAAKWSGVKVEQFAVGFGQALLSLRKGLGFRIGTSAKEFESRTQRYIDEHQPGGSPRNEQSSTTDLQRSNAARSLGISETEYRLNWIPLGGYVKMMGQDDLHANAEQTDPRAYNMKPISKRMVIVSAGVIMNVILAAVGFFVLFLIGFDVPPPVVGAVMPLSPAQQAGIHVGDRILEIDGRPQRDFTKIQLNVALMKEGEAVPVKVQHPDGQSETLSITPGHPDPDTTGFLALGIIPSPELQGVPTRIMTFRLAPKSLP
jgi:regulator of sigma E protease